ncbi:peroxiredoxin family protein [Algoriphagus namhaensis]|uniref:Peroxiredoxin family protein n=1 Tax=Algoriphagus namhaensis TaxID=915353 RepID=A0ABV8ANW6_9BACT
MKKTNLILLFIVLIGGTAYISMLAQNETPVQKPEVSAPEILPDFTLSDVNGNTSSIHDLAANKPTLFIYFNSTCHLCQDELGSISKRIKEFEDYSLIFTTVQPLEEMISFVDGLGIKDNPNVHFLLDAEMKVATFYQIRSVPSIYIYNPQKQLQSEYVGIVPIERLLSDLSE